MNDFLTELYKLLSQYDASVSVAASDCSDFYGISGEETWISVGNESLKIANEWGLDADDLKAYLDANVMQSQTLGENLNPD